MNRSESTRLGDQQAEGNLGNERVRNRSREGSMRDAREGSMRERNRDSEAPDMPGMNEEWSPGVDTHDNNGTRNRGRDR